MSSYLLTPEAKGDLFAVWSYIAQDNVTAADKVEAHIYEACSFLSANPFSGTSAPI